MARLAQIVETEVEKYAGSGRGADIRLFLVIDEKSQTYTVTAVSNPAHNPHPLNPLR